MTIAVIGAGASGMMAALTAAETPENEILLFERQARVGRKLAVTGNGRCNLTNTGAAPENYHGAQPDFAAPALAAFPPEAALRWFAAHGLMTVTEPGGRVYPLSNAANSVVDVLRFALARPNITLRAGEAVTAVRRQGHGFVIETESETIPHLFLYPGIKAFLIRIWKKPLPVSTDKPRGPPTQNHINLCNTLRKIPDPA